VEWRHRDILRFDETNGVMPKGEFNGGDGRDAITGGSGADALTGGTGIDRMRRTRRRHCEHG
jgi:Ca2+-binding RTX toxin-like protein